MAARIFAVESMCYRVAADVDRIQACAPLAMECSIVKVCASEMLGYVADEGVQIHGGYGFHQDYPVERVYRDSRIYRIFEGANEINRLLIAGMLLKQARQSESAVLKSALSTGFTAEIKQLTRTLLGLTVEQYGDSISEQQEVVASLSDVIMETFAIESVMSRAAKIAASGRASLAGELSTVFIDGAMARIRPAARTVIAACSGASAAPAALAALRDLMETEMADSIPLRRKIALRLSETGRYFI